MKKPENLDRYIPEQLVPLATVSQILMPMYIHKPRFYIKRVHGTWIAWYTIGTGVITSQCRSDDLSVCLKYIMDVKEKMLNADFTQKLHALL